MVLSYNDLQFQTYVNSSTAVTLRGEDEDGNSKNVQLTFSDVVLAAELAGLNMFFIADTGRGKTQLISDIYRGHFAAEGNWLVGRRETNVMDLFERTRVDLEQGYDSEAVRQLNTERLRHMLNCADEINRCPGPVQVDFFDLADGKYSFRGKRRALGRDGYCLFLATANVNRVGDNGFSGTFDIDRALWNRAHLTLDLDHKPFRPTAEDRLRIREQAADPRVKQAELRDFSEDILAAYKEIRAATRENSIESKLFAFLIDSGLDYCRQDAKAEEKMGTFPMACLNCPHVGDVCSQVKSASERSIQSCLALGHALDYVAGLKSSEPVYFRPLDVFLQAYRFTSHHGNLNEHVLGDEYAGRNQLMMDNLAARLSRVADTMERHLFHLSTMGDAVNTQARVLHQRVLHTPDDGNTAPFSQETQKVLAQNNVPFEVLDLVGILQGQGVGADWVQTLVKQEQA